MSDASRGKGVLVVMGVLVIGGEEEKASDARTNARVGSLSEGHLNPDIGQYF